MADVLKKAHAEDNPDYVYNPRKSSDKKRMTARKAATITGSPSSVAGPPTCCQHQIPDIEMINNITRTIKLSAHAHVPSNLVC